MTSHLHRSDFLDRATSEALRSLDPAVGVDPQVAGSPRAREILARILATDSAGPVPTPVRTGLARWPRRRWVVACVALVAVGALVVAPGVIANRPAVVPPGAKPAVVAPRGIAGNTAFASWTAKAKAMTPAETAAAGKKCTAQYSGPGGFGPGSDGKMVAQSHTVLVERRGVWTFVLLTGPGENGRGGFQATCLMKDSAAAVAGGPNTGGGGGSSARSYDGPAVLLAPNTAEVTDSGYVTVPGVRSASGDAAGTTWSSIGRVGSDVASVVINTIEQGPVTATIHDGYFAAWWPGPIMAFPKKGEPAPPEPASPTYTLILKDGTIRAAIPERQLWSKRQ